VRAGDIVVRTYGEGQRPMGLLMNPEPNCGSPIGPRYWRVRWFGRAMKEEVMSARFLKVYDGEG
jgi:hypothetical protein